jgi:hypothetical protein
MKKILISFLCASAIMSAAVPAVDAKAANQAVTTNSTFSVTQESREVQYILKVNNKNVNLRKLKIVSSKNHILVPLRITSEALGFDVKWDGNKQTVHMDNGIMQADLTLGINSYCAYSSKAIGMTKPVSLSEAPKIIGGSVYIPVEFYKIILTDGNCVSVKNGIVNISTKGNAENKTQIPNPLVNYNTVNEARKAAGFDFAVPAIVPDGYKMGDIIVISNDVAEIFYKNGDNQILYRTAKENADISGDYTVYDKVKAFTVGNSDITIKGNAGDNVNLATWTRDGVSFSLSFDQGVDQKVLSTMIRSIK